jgi:peptidoglycan/LPS O-acetylase OafA/YrhL
MSDSIAHVYDSPRSQPSVEVVRQSDSKVPTQSERIFYLDNVRALAMLLGVFFHGALAYAAIGHQFWLIGDREGSTVISVTAWFSHVFRMALFFLIAGYFAKLLVQKRGAGKFLINRGLRIALPFVVFLPIVTISIILVIVFATSYVQELPPTLAIIKSSMNPAPGAPPAPAQPASTTHLWFLYYLMMFSLISALFSLIKFDAFKKVIDWVFTKPALLLVAPLALVPAISRATLPVPAPESFVPVWWAFGFFGLFYFVGWCLREREYVLDTLAPYSWLFVGVSVALFVPLYMYFQTVDPTKAPPFWNYMGAATLNAYISVFMTVACLGLGKTYLSAHSKTMRLVSDSSYWTYLIHLPLIMLIQTFMVDWHVSVWVKLVLSVAGTYLISFLSYIVFVRYTPIGWMLNGRKRTQNTASHSHQQPVPVPTNDPKASLSATTGT